MTRILPVSSVRHDIHLLPTMLCQPCLTTYILRDRLLYSDKFMISSNFVMCVTGYALSYFRHMFNFLFWHLQCLVCTWSRSNFVNLQHSSLTAICSSWICPLLTSQQNSSSFCLFPNLHQRFSVKANGLSIHIPLLQSCAPSAALFPPVIPLLCRVNSVSSFTSHTPVVFC